jgi:hypothetical protein
MLNANKPHSPSIGLGHITASRANVRFTRTKIALPRRSTTYLPTPAFLNQPAPTALTDSDSDSGSDSDSDSESDTPTTTRALHVKRRAQRNKFPTPTPITHAPDYPDQVHHHEPCYPLHRYHTSVPGKS